MTFWYGSCHIRQYGSLQDANKLFFKFLFSFWRYISIILQGYKVIKKSQNISNQGFGNLFCLILEGSLSVQLLTDPGRPKKYVSGYTTLAGILELSLWARNRIRIGLSYRPARLHRLTESIPCNRFLGSLKVWKYPLKSTNMYFILCECRYTGWWFLFVERVLLLTSVQPAPPPGGGGITCMPWTFLDN